MLKRLLLIFVSVVLLPGLLQAADNIETLFRQGNKLYSASKYREAVIAYQKIIKQEYQSPEVYFNLANAFYKLGEIPYAILYYEKARKLNPTDEDINMNLRIANLKSTDKAEPIPEFFLNRWWKTVFMLFSLNTWAILAVISVSIASTLLIIYRFTTQVSVKKTTFFTSLVFFVFGLTAVFFALAQASYFNEHLEAIVFTPAVSVKSDPQPT